MSERSIPEPVDEIAFYYPAEGEGLLPAPVIPQEGARIWLNGRVVGTVGKSQPRESTPTFSINVDPDADYREVFGAAPEPWRAPLGALRLTLAGDPAQVDVARAQAECEELVRILNGGEA